MRYTDGVGELGWRVGWVCAYTEGTGSDDAEDKERVEERIEAVDAYCVAGLETVGFEAGDQLADELEGGVVCVVL